MSYAEAAGRGPKAGDLSYALAHYSKPIPFADLVAAVQRSAKICPIGIKTHARGALLSFKGAEREKVLARELWVGKSRIPLTIWPPIQTPPAQRGRRWRLKGLPFHISENELRDALSQAGFPPTEVKLETVPNFPTVRTEFATFWLAPQSTPPRSLAIGDEHVLIFDPIRKPSPPQEKEKEKEREPSPSPPPPQPEQPQPQPQPQQKEERPPTPNRAPEADVIPELEGGPSLRVAKADGVHEGVSVPNPPAPNARLQAFAFKRSPPSPPSPPKSMAEMASNALSFITPKRSKKSKPDPLEWRSTE